MRLAHMRFICLSIRRLGAQIKKIHTTQKVVSSRIIRAISDDPLNFLNTLLKTVTHCSRVSGKFRIDLTLLQGGTSARKG